MVSIPRVRSTSVIVPSHDRLTNAIALGLWEPAKRQKEHAPVAMFALRKTDANVLPPPPSPRPPPQTLFDSIHNPDRSGRFVETPTSPVPLLPLTPPGFINVHLTTGEEDAQDQNVSSKQEYLMNRDLLSKYCGNYNTNAIDTFKHAQNFDLIVPPGLPLYPDPLHPHFEPNENALDHLFPIFTNWLHSGHLVTSTGVYADTLSILTLSRLYVFGLLLSAPLFSNAVIDAMTNKHHPVNIFEPNTASIEDAILYVYGLPYMQLRTAVLEFVVRNSGPWIVAAFKWPGVAKKDCLDLLFGAAREGLEMRKRTDRCRLHVHTQGDMCGQREPPPLVACDKRCDL